MRRDPVLLLSKQRASLAIMFGLSPIELLFVTGMCGLLFASRVPEVYRALVQSLFGPQRRGRHDAEADQRLVNRIRAAALLAWLDAIIWLWLS